jgi:sulfur relay (sulfurtransferase) DsrC/TusE family protein
MTVTYKEFIEQIATLYAFGLSQRDEWELKMWHRAISDKNITKKQLSDAVLNMSQTVRKFWETDNVPAQLMELVEENQQVASRLALKNRLQLEKERHEADCKQIKESFGGTEEEAEENKAKIKAMLRGVFK